jgi:serine/threonine-protein kinase
MALDELEVLGQYQLLSRLAVGGMAEIFLARQTGIKGFEKLVVLKKILPQLVKHQEFVDMFLDEARIAARLRHTNIVQIYDLGQEGRDYFITMEYLEGESLQEVIVQSFRKAKALPPELMAFIIAHICDGLDYAHKFQDETGKPLNIIHRDVSHNNIVLLYSGGIKLVDFGVAKCSSQAHQSKVGELRGKLSYMSPEQCLSRPLDHRSDVFSTGIVLWELLAHKRLFKRDNEEQTIKAVVSGNIPLATEFRKRVPVELDAIAQRAMARDPGARYQSAGEMGEALRDALRALKSTTGHQDLATYLKTLFPVKSKKRQELLEKLRSAPDTPVEMEIEGTTFAVFEAAMDGMLGSIADPEPGAELPDIAIAEDTITDVSDSTPGPPTIPTFQDNELEQEFDTSKPTAPSIPPFYLDERAEEVVSVTDAPTRKFKRPVFELVLEKRRPLLIGMGALCLVLIVVVILLTTGDLPPVVQPEPTPPAADKEKSPLSAMLSVRSNPPGCKVDVNGNRAPTDTPINNLALDPGKQHSVTVTCEGFGPETKQVSAAAGERVALDFAPKRLTGVLRLNTSPWSQVYLGKRKLGITPLTGVRLPAGTHRLTVVNPEKGLRKTFNVIIHPDRTTTRQVDIMQ